MWVVSRVLRRVLGVALGVQKGCKATPREAQKLEMGTRPTRRGLSVGNTPGPLLCSLPLCQGVRYAPGSPSTGRQPTHGQATSVQLVGSQPLFPVSLRRLHRCKAQAGV